MADQPYVTTRRFGETEVSVINDGALKVPLPLVFPPPEVDWLRAHGEADDADLLTSHQAVVVIRHGGATIVVDPAFDDPGTPWDRHFATLWPGVERTAGLRAGLAQLGIDPAAVTHVVITHAHDDHFAGVMQGDQPRFPNARHLIGRADWEGNPRHAQPESDFATRLGRIAALGLLDPVEGEREIVPGVTMLHAPGESPGHSIVRVASDGQTCYAVGDLFHHACEVAHLDWGSPWVDLATMETSRRHLIAEATAADATLIFTHEIFPPWGRIVADGTGHRWVRDDASR